MRERAAEVLFKRKLLILLPMLVIVPITVALSARPQPEQWQSFSVIWINQFKPLYRDDQLTYAPATSQAEVLNGFIRTRAFALEVIGQTSLADLLGEPESEDQAMRLFWRSVQAWPSSTTFVTLVVTMDNPELTYEVAQAVLDTFRVRLTTQSEEQTRAGLQLYADALKKSEQAMMQSRAELAGYIASKPELAGQKNDSGPPLTARDATYARLAARANNDEDSYTTLRQRYDELQSTAGASATGQQLAFTVIDEPQQPHAPVRQSRLAMVKLPFIGVVMAMMIGAGIAVFLVLTNRAIFNARDLETSAGVLVLGEIPELRGRRWLWQQVPRNIVRLHLSQPARVGMDGVAVNAGASQPAAVGEGARNAS